MKGKKDFSGRRLKSARIFCGITIADLASETSLSKQAISQFENDRVKPSFETLALIANSLNFPMDYFSGKDKEDVELGNSYFRSKKTYNKRKEESIKEKIRILARLYSFVNLYVEFPKLKIPYIDTENTSIEEAASIVRKFWGIGQEPIKNMVYLMEKNGFIVSSISMSDEKVDACTQVIKINNIERTFVLLSKDKRSAVRRNFDAAHELGHRVYHEAFLDMDEITIEDDSKLEKEADEFAAAILLPKEAFLKDVSIHITDLQYYRELKKKWRVSIWAMVTRAYKLGAMNYDTYQYMIKKMSKEGMRKREPLDDTLMVPEPVLLKKSIDMLLDNEIFTSKQLLNSLYEYELQLPTNVIEELLVLDKGKLSVKEQEELLNIREIKLKEYK